jgi:DNA polymerase III epsilon subunit-like protein
VGSYGRRQSRRIVDAAGALARARCGVAVHHAGREGLGLGKDRGQNWRWRWRRRELLLRQRRRPAEAKNQHTYGEPRIHEDPPVQKDWLHSTLVEVWRARRPMREIVIDTETTGLDPLDGHRIVEIGAVELIDRAPTGQTFHSYIYPQRAGPADAVGLLLLPTSS